MRRMKLVGVRVVRGPDWRNGDEDGGMGVGKIVREDIEDETVIVKWYHSKRWFEYCTGKDDLIHLRAIDIAPSGITHTDITCDGCDTKDIRGFRWKCLKCYNFDLCTSCYMKDRHNLKHGFLRFDYNARTTKHRGVPIIARIRSEKVVIKKLKVNDWNENTVRENCTCYIGHLPPIGIEPLTTESTVYTIPVGSLVTLCLTERELDSVCENAFFGQRVLKFLDSIWRVLWLYNGRDYEVHRKGTSTRQRWSMDSCWNITHVGPFIKGDLTMICHTDAKIKEFQSKYANWDPKQLETRNMVGRIVKVLKNKNLLVDFNNTRWEYSRLVCRCLTLEEEIQWKRDGGEIETIPKDPGKLAKMMEEGTRVKRGRHWDWKNQDSYGFGTVVKPVNESGIIEVKWDYRGVTGEYRMGAENKYDLTMEWDTKTVKEDEDASSSSEEEYVSSASGGSPASSDREVEVIPDSYFDKPPLSKKKYRHLMGHSSKRSKLIRTFTDDSTGEPRECVIYY